MKTAPDSAMPDDHKSQAELEELEWLVAESDTGGREPAGLTAKLLLGVAIAWSLFQL